MNLPRNGKRILVAEDESEVQAYLEMALGYLGYSVELFQDGEELLKYIRSSTADFSAVLLDVILPRRDGIEVLKEIRHISPHVPVIVISGAASTLNVVSAMKCGATDFLCKPVSHDELAQALSKAFEHAGIAEVPVSQSLTPLSPRTNAYIGSSPQMHEIQSLIGNVGWSEAPVLIQGETGSGKEVIARELHAHSPRAGKVFLKLNCAALPSELVESELFGYERGAFTGAFQKKMGMFQAADGGTILLDEIGDMDVRLQAKLLQVLQDREFQRIGGRETIKVDVRVIAATHRDLRQAMVNGTFREDLYYRLNVINLVLPPLRERKEDLIALAEYLLKRHSQPGKKIGLTAELQETMLEYQWPGNVRELENVMRKLLVLRNPKLIARDLRGTSNVRTLPMLPKATPVSTYTPEPEPEQVRPEVTPASIFQQVTKAKERAETDAILAALSSTRWNRKQAAALLNIDYKALLYKMKKLGVEDNPAPFGPIAEERAVVVIGG